MNTVQFNLMGSECVCLYVCICEDLNWWHTSSNMKTSYVEISINLNCSLLYIETAGKKSADYSANVLSCDPDVHVTSGLNSWCQWWSSQRQKDRSVCVSLCSQNVHHKNQLSFLKQHKLTSTSLNTHNARTCLHRLTEAPSGKQLNIINQVFMVYLQNDAVVPNLSDLWPLKIKQSQSVIPHHMLHHRPVNWHHCLDYLINHVVHKMSENSEKKSVQFCNSPRLHLQMSVSVWNLQTLIYHHVPQRVEIIT